MPDKDQPATEVPDDRLSDPDNQTDGAEYVKKVTEVAFSGTATHHGSLADTADRPAEGGKRPDAAAKPTE